MDKKEDLRVIKTKTALVTAFFAILSEKSYEEMTVNELCDRAEVRRATFYKHYKDKNDFLVSVVKMLREMFDNTVWKTGKPELTKDYYIQYAEAMVNYLCRHTGAIENILKGEMRGTFVNVLIQQNYIDTLERLEKSRDNGMKLSASPETVAAFLTGGVAVAILHWFEGGRLTPKEEFISEITAVIDVAMK